MKAASDDKNNQKFYNLLILPSFFLHQAHKVIVDGHTERFGNYWLPVGVFAIFFINFVQGGH